MDNDKRFSSFSPIDDIFGYKSSGIFKCAYPFESILLIGGTLLCVLMFFGISSFAMGNGPSSKNSIQSFQYFLIELAAPVITSILWLIAMGVILSGRTFKYTADEYKFTVNYPNDSRPPIVIYYHDLSSIDYKEKNILLWKRGYFVTIKTKEGYTYFFDCMKNPSMKAFGTKSLPFYILEERAAAFEKEKEKGPNNF